MVVGLAIDYVIAFIFMENKKKMNKQRQDI